MINKLKRLSITALVAMPLCLATPGCALFDKNATTEQRANQIHDLAYAASSIGT